MKVLYLEIHGNLIVPRVVDLLRMALGNAYNFKQFDEMTEDSRPVFIHLICDNHISAWEVYEKIKSNPEINPKNSKNIINKPLISVQWYRTHWYHQVAAKAKQMEYNTKKMSNYIQHDV